MLNFESFFPSSEYLKKTLAFEYLEDGTYRVTYSDLEGNTYVGTLYKQPTQVEMLQEKIKELEAKLSTEQNLNNDN